MNNHLSTLQVRVIKRLLARRLLSHQEIADVFGVSRVQITHIAGHKRHKAVCIAPQPGEIALKRTIREQNQRLQATLG
jgi:hypothetical protein